MLIIITKMLDIQPSKDYYNEEDGLDECESDTRTISEST